MSKAAPTPPTTRRLWLWLTLLFALLIALAGGILRSTTGGSLADAILTGGKAFTATVTLCLTVLTAFRSR
jgi:hypothetical protein